ncbi:hypothetical protein C5615_07450 [Burkholderia cepacia]|uniref:Lipoprotein n=1 Tax=Burkholderia cepacia TaxID=292 RepID=A0A2S8IZJ3_BURCE|nr:hypothetical protein [Burkholderia pyrrocinia]PQP20099.1 hypothetical protein C5615_07450 [Burkholderia cepacia]EKS9888905.1 hypothetical protein [Burkholderia pyrrocinia]EKS9897583.1 hypothetical protein [Burkholderia pyrrocinia]EKS9910172.1 hypothetical protein [Burkholderia pyrrocinia]KFL54288.1 hypothetical protein JM78_12400 [Burkholderia pyrrocinia]
MRTSALRPFAVAGLVALIALLSACGDDLNADPAPVAQQKAACGGAAVATAQMRCPPGFTAPASSPAS